MIDLKDLFANHPELLTFVVEYSKENDDTIYQLAENILLGVYENQ
jgi:hypothetical protein